MVQSTSKVMPLEEAVRRFVRPGIQLHMETAARAAYRAIMREFRGQKLDLTLLMCRVGGSHAFDFVSSGLVKKVVAGSYGLVSRAYTGPMPQIQRLYRSGTVEFESWSLYSYILRLMAGALRQPFALTHSLVGSDLARENEERFKVIKDPFGSGRDVAVIPALNPDLSIVHVAAADEDGNAIMAMPMEESLWGAKASVGGVIVCTERIVPQEYIQANAHLVRLPALLVRAVCQVPFGAHPGAMYNRGVPDAIAYAEDEDFVDEYAKAARGEPQDIQRWLDAWVYGPKDHADYLKRLGQERLQRLQAASRQVGESGGAPPKNAAQELVMIAAMRKIMERVQTKGYEVLLAGAGQADIAAGLAYQVLRQKGFPIYVVTGTGYFGYTPSMGFSSKYLTSAMLADTHECYGVLLGGNRRTALALLGAGQIDKHGNLNLNRVGNLFLTGSGGANDAASLAPEALVVSGLSRRKFVERVDFITCPGDHVQTVVTDRGVFEKDPVSGELVLTSYLRTAEVTSPDQVVAGIQQNCGWQVRAAPGLREMPPPTPEETALLHAFLALP
ncbi:MAG: hypothetical protein HY684_07350 [Chloroflexi bacterium]|nr:hypothetical protein [Chloroflexota bacterium]